MHKDYQKFEHGKLPALISKLVYQGRKLSMFKFLIIRNNKLVQSILHPDISCLIMLVFLSSQDLKQWNLFHLVKAFRNFAWKRLGNARARWAIIISSMDK